MFWKSVIEGLAVLKYWQVWIAVVLYIVITFIFLLIIAKITGEDEYGERMAMGCLFHMIGSILLHGMLMGLMVAFLLPILLGGPGTTPVSVIVSLLWPIIRIGVFAIIVVTLLCLIPFVGGLIAHSPGIQAFLVGIITFRLLSTYAIDRVLTEVNFQGTVYPGFWASIGFLIIAGILVWVVMFSLALLSIPLEYTTIGELIPVVIGPVLGVLGGIIPLFMYSSYVRLSITQLIGG